MRGKTLVPREAHQPDTGAPCWSEGGSRPSCKDRRRQEGQENSIQGHRCAPPSGSTYLAEWSLVGLLASLSLGFLIYGMGLL